MKPLGSNLTKRRTSKIAHHPRGEFSAQLSNDFLVLTSSQCNSLEALNFSNRQFYKWLTTAPEKDTLTQYAFDYIDVRDMAEAFVNALRVEEAGNERFIVDAGQSLLRLLAIFCCNLIGTDYCPTITYISAAVTLQNLCEICSDLKITILLILHFLH